MSIERATYSPEDNKIRMYPAGRLDAATFARVKAAGFIWAPRQEIFVAPMWTPAREDLAEELAGAELEDEDTSLVDRAEERADRFSEYGENRARDAAQARAAVARIADGIPLGQPILIGHHSERHARKDAERIENGMRRAVKMWETAGYWKARAHGALRAAKYKELPAVRARRIKGIEADQRKMLKSREDAAKRLKAWQAVAQACAEGKPNARDLALAVANVSGYWSMCFPLADYPRDPPASQYEGQMGLWSALDGNVISAAQAAEIAIKTYTRGAGAGERWLEHYANRLAYERAMLEEQGGLLAQKFDLQPGGTVSWRGRRSIIVRVNRKDGAPVSVSVASQSWTVGVEEITAYEPPSEAAVAAVAKATKLPPLVNYPREGCVSMTSAQYADAYKDHKGTSKVAATETTAAHRIRTVANFVARRHGLVGGDQWGYSPVFLTDAKRTEAPPLNPAPRKSTARKIAEAEGVDTGAAPAAPQAPEAPAPTLRQIAAEVCAPTLGETIAEADAMKARRLAREKREAEGAQFEAMKQALRTGQAVQVVSAPQLFPTPAALAERMVELADLGGEIPAGECILEPSAGTGALVRAIREAAPAAPVLAVEINRTLAAALEQLPGVEVVAGDFLAMNPSGTAAARAIVMNPPFENGADIKHILHARRFLAPGGCLVAICAGGPRQKAALEPIAAASGGIWEPLPAGTFAEQGTNVNTVLLTMYATADQRQTAEV